MSIVAQSLDFTVAIALLAERMEERRRRADAITDATFDHDAAQFAQADAAVNAQCEHLAAIYTEQGCQDGNW